MTMLRDRVRVYFVPYRVRARWRGGLIGSGGLWQNAQRLSLNSNLKCLLTIIHLLLSWRLLLAYLILAYINHFWIVFLSFGGTCAMANDEILTDDYVAGLLSQEANDCSLKYSAMGMEAYRINKK